jgi:hypothetical protein
LPQPRGMDMPSLFKIKIVKTKWKLSITSFDLMWPQGVGNLMCILAAQCGAFPNICMTHFSNPPLIPTLSRGGGLLWLMHNHPIFYAQKKIPPQITYFSKKITHTSKPLAHLRHNKRTDPYHWIYNIKLFKRWRLKWRFHRECLHIACDETLFMSNI